VLSFFFLRDGLCMSIDTKECYDSRTLALHWATAVLIVVLWVIGQTADWLPKGPLNTSYWSLHVLLGFLLAIVLCMRIWWRVTGGRRLPPADSGILQIVARSVHYILYALLIGVVVLGITNAVVRGYSLFGLLSIPQSGDRALRRPLTHWHGLLANLLLVIAFAHAGAALVHHYWWHDDVLKRMLPPKKAPKVSARS
jgi:cytochrome b561